MFSTFELYNFFIVYIMNFSSHAILTVLDLKVIFERMCELLEIDEMKMREINSYRSQKSQVSDIELKKIEQQKKK